MDWIIPVSTLLLFILIVILVLLTRSFGSKGSQLLPPGPWPLPLVGNLLIMDKKRPYRTMLKVRFSVLFSHAKQKLY